MFDIQSQKELFRTIHFGRLSQVSNVFMLHCKMQVSNAMFLSMVQIHICQVVLSKSLGWYAEIYVVSHFIFDIKLTR